MWQNDWSEFAKVVDERLRQGVASAEIASEFNSHKITWTGILIEKDIDELAPAVVIAVPEAEIAVGDSCTIHVSELVVPAAWDAVQLWQGIPIGTSVTFTAVLGDSVVFPPVEVSTLSTGRRLLDIRVSDGRPILP